MTDRVTILAENFTAAAMEFHRSKMAKKGYRLEAPIQPHKFQIIKDGNTPEDIFQGRPMYAATFLRVKKESKT